MGAGRNGWSMVDTRPAVEAAGTMTGRLAALAGAVSFALILISATMLSNAPSATDSGQKILSYLALHHGRLQLGAVLTALAMATALVWAAGLSRALRKAEGGTPALALAAFGGVVLAAACCRFVGEEEARAASATGQAPTVRRAAGAEGASMPRPASSGSWSAWANWSRGRPTARVRSPDVSRRSSIWRFGRSAPGSCRGTSGSRLPTSAWRD